MHNRRVHEHKYFCHLVKVSNWNDPARQTRVMYHYLAPQNVKIATPFEILQNTTHIKEFSPNDAALIGFAAALEAVDCSSVLEIYANLTDNHFTKNNKTCF